MGLDAMREGLGRRRLAGMASRHRAARQGGSQKGEKKEGGQDSQQKGGAVFFARWEISNFRVVTNRVLS